MNESDFENELRGLQPTAPSPSLASRIAAELPTRAVTVASARTLNHAPASGVIARPAPPSLLLGVLRRLLWATAGAAAAVVVMSYQNTTTNNSDSHVATVQPTAANQASAESVRELINTTDEGLIVDETTAAPQRQMRYTYLERHFWTTPQTGAVIEFEVPREDVVLMPVAMQ